LAKGRVTLSRYLAGRHVGIERKGVDMGPSPEELRARGIRREIATTVPGFSTALLLARGTDLIATVPARHTGGPRTGMHTFPLPFKTPEITVSMLWHPRQDADPAHRWLRECVREVCRESPG
jgi:DNA-binding transcriptional LysR family regulator